MEGSIADTPNFNKETFNGVLNNSPERMVEEQFLKTAVGKSCEKGTYHAMRTAVDTACRTAAGKKVVSRVATQIAGKPLYGAASRTVASSAMKGNVVSAGVCFVVTSAGDTLKFCTGRQSGEEYCRNMGRNAVETGGSLAGAAIGAAIGSAVPIVGTAVGGFVGSVLGGLFGRKVVS